MWCTCFEKHSRLFDFLNHLQPPRTVDDQSFRRENQRLATCGCLASDIWLSPCCMNRLGANTIDSANRRVSERSPHAHTHTHTLHPTFGVILLMSLRRQTGAQTWWISLRHIERAMINGVGAAGAAAARWRWSVRARPASTACRTMSVKRCNHTRPQAYMHVGPLHLIAKRTVVRFQGNFS